MTPVRTCSFTGHRHPRGRRERSARWGRFRRGGRRGARLYAERQRANDPRVIRAESDDIAAAVKKNGVPVESVVFQDEGHGFSRKKNQTEGYSAVLKFLDTHLKGKAAGTR